MLPIYDVKSKYSAARVVTPRRGGDSFGKVPSSTAILRRVIHERFSSVSFAVSGRNRPHHGVPATRAGFIDPKAQKLVISPLLKLTQDACRSLFGIYCSFGQLEGRSVDSPEDTVRHLVVDFSEQK
jgi:hypothetical protein